MHFNSSQHADGDFTTNTMELVLKINYKMKWLSEHCLPLPLHYASASRLAAICLHSVFRSISSKHFWNWNYLICDLLKRFLFQRIILLNLIHIPAFIYNPFFVLLNNTPHHFEKKWFSFYTQEIKRLLLMARIIAYEVNVFFLHYKHWPFEWQT